MLMEYTCADRVHVYHLSASHWSSVVVSVVAKFRSSSDTPFAC